MKLLPLPTAIIPLPAIVYAQCSLQPGGKTPFGAYISP